MITARKLSLLAYFRDLADDHIILHTLIFIAAILQSGNSIAMKMDTPQQSNFKILNSETLRGLFWGSGGRDGKGSILH